MKVNITTKNIVRFVEFMLLVVIAALLIWSQPWNQDAKSSDETRRITVSGETTIQATPDEFTFYPYFEMTGTDKDVLRTELTTKANEVVEGLRGLGVEDDAIQLDASAYDRWYWGENQEGVLSVSLTVTASGDDLVQSIQDYLLTTDALGQITPQATFSDEKKRELDKKAVEEASADAREKAQTQAALFGSELGDVIEIKQGSDTLFAEHGPIQLDTQISARAESLPILPGQNEYTQTVVVTYELKK